MLKSDHILQGSEKQRENQVSPSFVLHLRQLCLHVQGVSQVDIYVVSHNQTRVTLADSQEKAKDWLLPLFWKG